MLADESKELILEFACFDLQVADTLGRGTQGADGHAMLGRTVRASRRGPRSV